jgi:hypothetical protein
MKILCDAHHNITHKERIYVHETLKDNKQIDFSKKVSIMEIFPLYNQYHFALSPRGNGIDCHRTWELLLAGVIVITKTSLLDDMYHDLPVVILKDWNELNNLEQKLKEWYQIHIHKTSMEYIAKRLTFQHWFYTF